MPLPCVGTMRRIIVKFEDPPKSGAKRQAEFRKKGRQIAVVLRDEDAIAALDRLAAKHGGVTAAVTFALHAATRARST